MSMIDIGEKQITKREAIVEVKIHLKQPVIRAIKERKIPKGDVLEAARFAGILAAKKTPEIIPLCHPIPIEYAEIKFSLGKKEIKITTTIKAVTKTGVEMEAFVASSIAALTIYDMCKAFDREAIISELKLIKKTGGKSGAYFAGSSKI